MLDCESHKNLMSEEIIKHFNENNFAYDKIYLNSNVVSKMKPSGNVVLFVNITPQSYNRNDDKSHYYYNIRVVNVGK